MIDHYDWAGGRESMLRLGPDNAPVAALALPLFEEANRTRTFAVTIMRALAERGIASALPDLPGTNDSLVATADVRLADWRTAFASAASGAIATIAIRSGALIDGAASVRGRWHLSPQDGSSLVRELQRVGIARDGATVEVAGNTLSRALLDDLTEAEPRMPARVVRLAGDPRAADRIVEAAPLWRRAEPGNDTALAAILADDIAEWVRRCAG